MKNKKIKSLNLLDCTLRDGGYYNNWDFDIELINQYLLAMHKSGIKFVELGFRGFPSLSYKGPCAYTTDQFLRLLKIPRKLKIGVMVNASEIINYGKGDIIANTKKLFPNKDMIDFVRVACHFEELDVAAKISSTLKTERLKIIYNVMQCSERLDKEIETIGIKLNKFPIDVLYFADSMGSLSSVQTSEIINLIKKNWKKEIGIHTHDNMLRAFTNTDQAIMEGVSWVDGTVTGMGRGPGNIKTEYLLINYQNLISRKKIDFLPILKLIEKYFQPLLQKYNWGTNPFYFMAGVNGIHPTFIQDILKDHRYSISDKLLFIDHLKLTKSNKFDKNLLDIDRNLYKLPKPSIETKKWVPSSKLKNKTILILGNSPTLKKNIKLLESFIKRKKPVVFGLNLQKSINEKLINYRVVCNLFRLLTDKNKYKSTFTKIILPKDRIQKNILNSMKKNKIFNVDLRVSEGEFIFKNDSVIIPNSLVFSYALGIAGSGQASEILLAGFGSSAENEGKNIDMERTSEIFSIKSKIKISSITNTNYKVDLKSIYD